MRIADGVEMLEISAIIMGRMDVIHPTLFWDEEEAILVDTGYPGQLALFREALEQTGVPLERLSKIVLTHQDIDHIGTVSALQHEANASVVVLANAEEKPFIQGEQRLLKITPEAIAGAMAALPPEMPEQRRLAFKAALENPPKGRVDATVADGEELLYCGGIIIINTPGHTPGHICLYHKRSKTLVAGDAMRVVDGKLLGPSPHATLDMALATASLKKLVRYDIETVICYHGGLYRGHANQRIAELAA